jgi:hypothetical protein
MPRRPHAGIVERLQARRTEIVQAIYAHVQDVAPDSIDSRDRAYQDGILAAVMAVLDYCLEGIEHGPGSFGPIPPEAAAQARRAARSGVGLGTVLLRYIVGHKVLGNSIMDETDRSGLLNDGPALRRLRTTQDALLEHLTAAITKEYNEERKQATLSHKQRRREVVRRLLASELVDPVELAELDYELHTSWHLGMIAAGSGAEKIFQHLAAGSDRSLLCVPCGKGTLWGWLGGQQKLTAVDVGCLLAASGCGNVLLAIGEPGRGIDGWHLTHHQAREALGVAMHKRERFIKYADNLLLAAAVQNRTLAKSLRQRYLVPLRGHRDAVALCETLRAYIDAECNATSAGHALGVGRRTIESRLRTAEKLIDRPLRGCLAELDVALRLENVEGFVRSDVPSHHGASPRAPHRPVSRAYSAHESANMAAGTDHIGVSSQKMAIS